MATILLLLFVTMGVFVFDVTRRQWDFLTERARSRILFQAQMLATSSHNPLLTHDLTSLRVLTDQFKSDPGVRYAMVTDPNGRVLSRSDVLHPEKDGSQEGNSVVLPEDGKSSIFEFPNTLEATVPILSADGLLGWAWVNRDLTEVRAQLREVRNLALIHLSVALAVGTLLAWFMARAIIRPLKLLLAGTERLAHDQLEELVPGNSNNEVGVVTRGFNQAMQRIAAQTHELEKSRRVAEQANLAKSQFLANMSHEIRTPLGAILGFSNLIQDPKLSPGERRQFIEVINRNGEELSRLINDLLDLSRVEAGKMHFERREIELATLVFEILATLKPRAQEKGLTIWFSTEPNVPRVIYSDPTRLRQILINLIGNAIKFTEVGGVTVVVRNDPRNEYPSRVTFLVEDTGTGINVVQQRQLFQRFTQADSSATRRFGGTGLGLFLSRRLARELGGDVVLVQSLPGKGSLFSLTVAADLQIHGSPSSVENDETVATGDGIEPDLRGLRILAVEDSLDNQLLIQRLLSKRGAQVDIAVNGAEGVQKALADKYNMVLMDLQMPIMDGYHATAELRRQGYQRPIVALTAHALQEDRSRCLESGFDEHLTKPISPAALVQTIVHFTSFSS